VIDFLQAHVLPYALDFFVRVPVGCFALVALLEAVRPGRKQVAITGWKVRGVLAFLFSLALSLKAPLLWDGWLAGHTLIDASGLGHVGGALVAFVLFELALYGWHRALHRVPFLFRWFHQMHHSAERVDVWGAYLFHPLDQAAFSLLSSLVLVGGLGLTTPAVMAASAAMTFCAFFQHANLRTPRWIGWIVQRPESHALHHERGIHAWNYSDLPLWDFVFGTFRNPAKFGGPGGYWDGASARVGAMLIGRDVTSAPATPATRADARPVPQPERRPKPRMASSSSAP